MKHVTITELGNGYYRMIPENGYMLYHKITDKYYSEAETRDINQFIAVAID